MMKSKMKFVVLAALTGLVAGCMDTTSTEPNSPYQSFEIAEYDNWSVRRRFSTRDEVFQNVTAEDLTTLLSGKTFVGYEETSGLGNGYGALSARFYAASGAMHVCVLSYKTGRPKSDAYAEKRWQSSTVDNHSLGYRLPETVYTELDGSFTYGFYMYDAPTGRLAELGFSHESQSIHDVRKGHLQNGIPAGVYTACPDFPSAESLGTFVNETQTNWNYFRLLEQDRGERVVRPDLVTEFTPIPLSPEVTR